MRKPGFAIPIVLASLLLGVASGQSAVTVRDIKIGAYDADTWNGIVFLAGTGAASISFGLRIGSRSGSFLDGSDIYKAVTEVGPHAPDDSYCRMSWRHPPREAPITLEWSRAGADVTVGRITAAGDVQLVLEGYLPKMGMPEGPVLRTRHRWTPARRTPLRPRLRGLGAIRGHDRSSCRERRSLRFRGCPAEQYELIRPIEFDGRTLASSCGSRVPRRQFPHGALRSHPGI